MTTVKCNLTRHCIRIHKFEIIQDKNIANKGLQIANNEQNISNEQQKISSSTSRPFQCEQCSKILACKKTFTNHQKICKGVKNILECHNCHMILANPSAKCRHLKSCLAKSLTIPTQTTIPPSPTTTPQTINNTYISGNQNNTVNNTINNNITILTVDPTKLENLEFITDHITNPELKKILKITHKDMDDSKKITMLETYMRHLMTNPANKCIKKTNMQNVYSQVHTGDNKWETKHDKELYPKLTCNVAQGFSGLMVLRNSDAPMIKTERKLEELKAFLDYMADEGYRNDSNPDINHQTHLDFKELVQRIKGVIFDVFKIAM